ncbi:MAG: PAS domain S-box protein [Candidatus Hydrogenedentota bacterium]|nr:MAG: PAS domain S-box protein [Candidatus Hydrogenedentota bacterium]
MEQLEQEKLFSEIRRLKSLLDSSPEVHFELNNNLEFCYVNKAIRSILGFNPEQVIGVPFATFIHNVTLNGENPLTDFIKQVDVSESAVSATFSFNRALSNQHVVLKVTLQKASSMQEAAYLGRMSPVEKEIGRYVQSETIRLSIPNDFTLVEEVVRHFSESLSGKLNSRELLNMEIATKEMLFNAIEHGNLEITFPEKNKAKEDGFYSDLLAERMMNPEFGRRRVYITFVLDDEKVVITIRDDGPGFDHKNFREKIKPTINEEMQSHGRGIQITEAAFDSVTYNEKGNMVTLLKRLKKQKA